MSKIEKLPYPENIQFTTKELQRYEDEQYKIDKDANEWLDRNYWNKVNTGTVIIYKNQEDEDLVVKRAEQLLWDLGKGDDRPKTNVDILKYKMGLIRGLYLKETDIDNKKKLFNAIKILGEKIPEAIDADLAVVSAFDIKYNKVKNKFDKLEGIDKVALPILRALKLDLAQLKELLETKANKEKYKIVALLFNDLLNKSKDLVGGKLDATELKGLINASYDGREQVGDWVIDKKLSTNTSKVYTNNEGRAVVAHKGTEGISDWGNNLAFAVGGEYLYKKTDRFKEAKKVQNKAEKKYGAENVSTIGHSQGGLQAELLGSKSKEIITLNKATHPLAKLPLVTSSNQSKNQTDIRSDRDVVSSATKTPTTEIKAISYNPLTEHSPKILDRVSKDTQYGSGLSKQADNISEYDEINKYSNPKKVQEKAKKYLGEGAIIYRSAKKDKKYMIYNPNTKKWVHFGQMPYEDFTKHQDPKRRENYLKRTANMRGNWKNDKYSANNLSREILW